jgi:hypothetical protein
MFHQVINTTCHLFQDCMFVNISNSAQTGGAIYFQFSSGTNLTNYLIRCTFFRCSSGSGGGGGGGGGIRSSGCSLNLCDCCVCSCWTGNGTSGQFLYAESGSVVNLTNPSISLCPPPSAPSTSTLGTVYLSTGMRMGFWHANFTGCRILVNPTPTDGAALYIAGSGSYGDRCDYGTFVNNFGRTVAQAGWRANVTYGDCNFVGNAALALLYQGSGGSTTLDRCIFVGNRNATDYSHAFFGIGDYVLFFCVFDSNVPDTILWSTGVIVTASPQTHPLWHLNTALCHGFPSPTSDFTFSLAFFVTPTFGGSALFPPSPHFGWSADLSPISSAWRLSRCFHFSRIAPHTAVFSRSLSGDQATVLVASFAAPQTAIFSSSLPTDRSPVLVAWFTTPRTAIFSRSLPDDRSIVLVASFTAPQTAIFSLSLPPGQSPFLSPTNAATALSDDGESTRPALLLVILLPLVAAIIAFAVGFLVFLRIRGYANCRRYAASNDSDDSSPTSLAVDSDTAVTVNTTLTMTLLDRDDSQWIAPAVTLNTGDFG